MNLFLASPNQLVEGLSVPRSVGWAVLGLVMGRPTGQLQRHKRDEPTHQLNFIFLILLSFIYSFSLWQGLVSSLIKNNSRQDSRNGREWNSLKWSGGAQRASGHNPQRRGIPRPAHSISIPFVFISFNKFHFNWINGLRKEEWIKRIWEQ